MLDKKKYIQKLKELYELKNKKVISDDEALNYFENLVCLVGAITKHTDIKKLILPKKYENGKK